MKNAGISLLILTLVLSVLFILETIPARAASLPLREFKVGVVVSPEVQTSKKWKAAFEKRLAYASKIFRSAFNIKFVPVSYRDWDTENVTPTMENLIQDLQNRFPLKEVDMIIGLARLEEVANPEDVRDLHALGITRPFTGYMVLRYPKVSLFKIQEETVMIHELGHLFGALHTREADTVMAPVVVRQIPTAFDAENREIILQTRGVQFNKGMEVLQQGAIERLLNSYLRLKATAQRADFYYSLGLFYLKLGQKNETIRAWNAALEKGADHPRLHFDLGYLYIEVGDNDKAVRELSKAISGFSAPRFKREKLEALNLMGGAHFQRQDYAGAYQAWSTILRLDPKNAEAKVHVALVQIIRGQLDDGIRLLNEALRLKQKDPKILSNLGFAYLRKERYEKATGLFERAMQYAGEQTVTGPLGPLHAGEPSEINRGLGMGYLGLKDTPSALRHFETSCRMNASPNCQIQLGELYFKQQRWGACVGQLAGALKEVRDNPDLYGVFGVCLAKSGDPQTAIEVFQEGLNRAGDQKLKAQFNRNMGNVYLEHSQWDYARDQFRKAIQRDWGNADSHYGAALVYVSEGRYPEAQQALRNALNINPSHQGAKGLLTRVDASMR